MIECRQINDWNAIFFVFRFGKAFETVYIGNLITNLCQVRIILSKIDQIVTWQMVRFIEIILSVIFDGTQLG